MSNELLLLMSLVLIYGGVIISFVCFRDLGLYFFGIVATLLANIEVVMLIRAFGLEQTLGNLFFASTFLLTDALSEIRGKKFAQRAIGLNVLGSLVFLAASQIWLLYHMQDAKTFEAVNVLFSQTPRIIVVSLIVFVIASYIDVWLYHWWWALSTKIWGEKEKFLWLRNNASTLSAQFINTLLFSFGAFAGVLEISVIWQIIASSYAIFIVTSLLDTPALYLISYLSKRYKQTIR